MITTDNDKFYRGIQFQAFFKNSSRSLVLKADAPLFTILAVSDTYLSLTHKQRHQLLGRGLFEVFPGSAGDLSEQNSVHSSFMRAIATRAIDELPIFKYEIYVAETDSYVTEYWTNVNEPLLDDDGNVAYLINTTTNITRQLVTEQALEKTTAELQALNERLAVTNQNLIAVNNQQEILLSELTVAKQNLLLERDRLNRFFMQVPAGVCVLDGPEHVYELVNKEYQKLFPGRRLHGLPLLEALPEIRGTAIGEILNKVYTTGETYAASSLLVPLAYTADGPVVERYFNFVYQARLNSNDSVDGILVLVFEVTEQARSQQKIVDLNAQLSNMNEDLAAANEELISVNEHQSAINAELDDLNKQLLVSRLDAEQAENTLRVAIEAANFGTWHINTKTRELNANDKLKELFGFKPEDKVAVADCIAQITEDYRAPVSSAIEHAINSGGNYDLSYTVRGYHDHRIRWVRALGNSKMDEEGAFTSFTGVIMDITEQKADEQRKNDFIGMVSHELKTPLTSLNAYLQMLQARARKTDDAFTLNSLDKSVSQVKKMTTMINGFLNVSRLESGKIHIDKRNFDMADLVKEVEEESVVTVTSHKVIFAPVVKTCVVADRDKVGQVINNFISNAVKYSPLGSTIQIACVTVGNHAQVSVQDEGFGIKPEDQQKLFDRYYRVESNAAHISGFGIGLYLCAEIIQRHEGKIWVQSEVGKGSTFYFSIPLESSTMD